MMKIEELRSYITETVIQYRIEELFSHNDSEYVRDLISENTEKEFAEYSYDDLKEWALFHLNIDIETEELPKLNL
jgi:hypothetical protein